MSEVSSRQFALIALVGLLVGCNRSEPTEANTEPQDRVEQSPVVVTVVDRAGYDAVLVSLRGKIVLVDCWASWCLPCLEQLPHTLKLAGIYPDLAVVTLCFDDPRKSQQVAKFLSSKGGSGNATHLVSEQGGSSRSMEEFEVPGGALPYYKLYDSAGRLRRTFELDPAADKQFAPAEVETAVKDLLEEVAPNSVSVR